MRKKGFGNKLFEWFEEKYKYLSKINVKLIRKYEYFSI